MADRVIRESVSPLVDHSDGKMLVDSVAQSLFHLIRCEIVIILSKCTSFVLFNFKDVYLSKLKIS